MKSQAIVQRGASFKREEVQLPDLKEHQVYVKVENAAFNPTDRLALDVNAFGDGAVLGCDFAGTVVQAHPTSTRFSTGDRVAALVWGGEISGLGAYSEYTIADERLSFLIPGGITATEASSIPLAVNTAWLALFSADCLALDRNANTKDRPQILIWGGSSTVGYFAIQLAHLYGFTVATTCSPRNSAQVKAAGATHVFDYNDSDVVGKIRNSCPGLRYVFDTIGSPTSSTIAAQTIKGSIETEIGALCTVRPGKAHTENVPANIKVSDVFVFTAFPTEHSYRGKAFWPVKMEDHKLSVELYEQIPQLLQEKSLKPPRVRQMGELTPEKLEEGMALNREGKISNEKLVFGAISNP